MTIFLTFDYELFFGKKSGSIEKCLLEPTDSLIEIAKKYDIKLTFFVDCGYLWALEKNVLKFPKLKVSQNLVVNQLQQLVELGHTCELHIHPHWEDTVYDGFEWKMDTSRYKLSDFSEAEILDIFKKYKGILESTTGVKTTIYRAGGWCLQPFSIVERAFSEMGIKMDSTVFHKGYLNSSTHYYDFRNSPDNDSWVFTQDLCTEEVNGKYLEVPISSFKYNPLFFWKLYGLGRIFRKLHKPIGDGIPVASKGMKSQYLTSSQWLPVSCDGYFSSQLNEALEALKRSEKKYMVVIGHPKACTRYSLKKMCQFVESVKGNNLFAKLSEIKLKL